MRKYFLLLIATAYLTGCSFSLKDPIISDSVAVQQRPNIKNATESAQYFNDNIDQYLTDPQLVKDFASYNATAWESVNIVYNPSATGVPND